MGKSNEPATINLQSAAVASGLVTREEVARAFEAMRSQAEAPVTRFKDEQLAAKLIEMGCLNYWQAEQLLAGKTKFSLGPYRILDSLGQGGMGQVFKGQHNLMRRTVAIKVLPKTKATPSAIANFMNEIQAQAQLDHPNLVRAFDAGQDGPVYYLVTEYVPGCDLRKLIRRQGRLTMHAAATIVCQAASGLEHAHLRGLIHRDVKPGNLLVTPEGFTKVSDLGLAGFYVGESAVTDAEKKSKIVGTADYLAPEQVLTPEKLTPSCDIYALGCTMYYAVTGKVPYPGGTTQDKARSHCMPNIRPLDPRRLNPELEDDFVNVLARMMEKDLADRVPTMGEVVKLLSPWAGEAGRLAAQAAGAFNDQPNPAGPRTNAVSVAQIANDLRETRSVSTDDVEEYVPENDQLSQISQASQSSQISQGTMPLSGAMEETFPDYATRGDGVGVSPGVLILIIIGLATAVGALGAVFVLMLFR